MYSYIASIQAGASTVMTDTRTVAAVRIVEAEIGQPLLAVSALDETTSHHYSLAHCLVRLHTQPLGVVELPLEGNEMSADACAQKIWQHLHVQINDHLQQDGLPAVNELTAAGLASADTPACLEERTRCLAHAPFVSVIVSTHDRPQQLAPCLHSLLSLHYPRYEVIVVDNAPSTNATAHLVQKLSQGVSHLRYVREDLPGLSWARNRGVQVAKGEILAFTDDDVIVDPYWLAGLAKGFTAAEHVACVTGLILPLELETPAQFLFEEYAGMARGFSRSIFSLKERHPEWHLYPYTTWHFGAGASMAFTASFIKSVGGFDPALGGPGPVRNSQDVAAFFQVIARGYQLVYEPSSLLYHLHRRDYINLRKQVYNYGLGFAAHVTKGLLENPQLLFDFTCKLAYALFSRLLSARGKQEGKTASYPKALIIASRKGMLEGAFAYILSRRRVSRLTKRLDKAALPVTRESLAAPR